MPLWGAFLATAPLILDARLEREVWTVSDLPPLKYNEKGILSPSATTVMDWISQQQHMKEEIAGLKDDIREFLKSQRENQISRKDVVNWTIGGIISVGAMFAGLFFLIGTQVAPLQTSMATLEKSVWERFSTQAEVIKSLRDNDLKEQQTMDDLRLENARLQSRLEIEYQKKPR